MKIIIIYITNVENFDNNIDETCFDPKIQNHETLVAEE